MDAPGLGQHRQEGHHRADHHRRGQRRDHHDGEHDPGIAPLAPVEERPGLLPEGKINHQSGLENACASGKWPAMSPFQIPLCFQDQPRPAQRLRRCGPGAARTRARGDGSAALQAGLRRTGAAAPAPPRPTVRPVCFRRRRFRRVGGRVRQGQPPHQRPGDEPGDRGEGAHWGSCRSDSPSAPAPAPRSPDRHRAGGGAAASRKIGAVSRPNRAR